jgi:hypothetical protein
MTEKMSYVPLGVRKRWNAWTTTDPSPTPEATR